MVKNLFAAFFCFCLSVCLAGASGADEFHYTNLLIGDRASGMGGAYTAVSDDATGLYYNPAGIVYSSGRNISASVNAYYATEKQYSSVISGHGWERTSASLLPNYFGVVQPLGSKIKIGISYAVPESIVADQDQVFNDLPLSASLAELNPDARISSYIINFNEESNTYNFGPTIAAELSGNLSAGLTLYYYQRRNQVILNQIIKTTNGGSEWTNVYFQTEEWGVRPILGFMLTPADSISIGLAISKTIVSDSETSRQEAYRRENIAVLEAVDTDGDGVADEIQSVSNSTSLPDGQLSTTAKRKYPTQVSLGVAWFPSASLLLSADVNYFPALQDLGVEQVTNIALGTEYYLSKNWAMRGGFYTNYANTPELNSSSANQREHIDLYGLTGSVSHFTRNTSVTLGAGYTFGDGQAQIISNSSRIQDAEYTGWMIFLSSSYSY
jgi:long-chain fatty acid transport protein